MLKRFDKWMTGRLARDNSYLSRTVALMAGMLAFWPMMYVAWKDGSENVTPLMVFVPFLFWTAPLLIWFDEREAAGKGDISKVFWNAAFTVVMGAGFAFWVLVVMAGLWLDHPYEQLPVPVLMALVSLGFVVYGARDLDRAVFKLEARA